MLKHIPILGAIWPAAAGLWFVHPNSATATVAGVTAAAALAETKLKAVARERTKRKLARANAERQAVDIGPLGGVHPRALPQSQTVRYDEYVDHVPGTRRVIDLGRAE